MPTTTWSASRRDPGLPSPPHAAKGRARKAPGATAAPKPTEAPKLGLVALSTALGMRVAYMEALGDGLTVAELSEPSAKVEARFLTEEVQKLLRKTS